MIETKRIYWLDNLRTFLIFLVVLFHVAVIYEKFSMGALWWILIDPSNSDLPGILFLILNIFVIATLFFIGGYFAPLSLKSKTWKQFIVIKFKRIIIPWIIAVLTLIPFYKIIFLYSRGLPQEHWFSYFHWTNGIWGMNWLWFLPILFIFEMLYLLFSKIDTSKINLRNSIIIVFIISFLFSFMMDFFGFHGWTYTFLFDFQNERIFIYFMMFLLGSQCYKLNILNSEKRNKRLDIILDSIGWIPIGAYVFMLIYSLITPNYLISKVFHIFITRISFVLSLAYLLYVSVNSFRKYFNKTGKIIDELNKNSYYVYIIHVIILGLIALLMLNTGIHSLLKMLISIVVTYIISNLMVSGFRKTFSGVKL